MATHCKSLARQGDAWRESGCGCTGPRAAEEWPLQGTCATQKPFPGSGGGWTKLRGAKNYSTLLPWTWNLESPEASSILHQRGCQEGRVASVRPRGAFQPQLPSEEGEGASARKKMDEVTVLVASMEAINTGKVVLQHHCHMLLRLPSSVDSESSAQGVGVRSHMCLAACTRVSCGCCERSPMHRRRTERGPRDSFLQAQLCICPSLPCFSLLSSSFLLLLFSLPPSSCLSPFFCPSLFHPFRPMSLSALAAPSSVSSFFPVHLSPLLLSHSPHLQISSESSRVSMLIK